MVSLSTVSDSRSAAAALCRPLRPRLAVALLAVGLAGGCSKSDRPRVAPVSGTVTYHDQPVEGAQVMFMPTQGRPATGKTNAEGRFTLSTFGSGDGAILGHHAVTIAKRVPLNDKPYAPERSEVPERYASGATSGLTADVSGNAANDFPFALTDAGK
jgi:hypothetical protein